MQGPVPDNDDPDSKGAHPDQTCRRDLWLSTAVAGTTVVGGNTVARERPDHPLPEQEAAPGRGGLLYPQQNQLRNLLDLSGLWQFQLDPEEEGEGKGWFKALPAPRPIAVPCSWNDLFDDARDYLGLAWYRTRRRTEESPCNRYPAVVASG